MSNVLNLDNPLFRTYLYYSGVLCVKVLLMAPLTGVQRFTRKAFANPEDCAMQKVKPRVDENVERVRRAHRNDLENILIFLAISFAYILTNPSITEASILFKVVTYARILHTLVYAFYAKCVMALKAM